MRIGRGQIKNQWEWMAGLTCFVVRCEQEHRLTALEELEQLLPNRSVGNLLSDTRELCQARIIQRSDEPRDKSRVRTRAQRALAWARSKQSTQENSSPHHSKTDLEGVLVQKTKPLGGIMLAEPNEERAERAD